MSEKPPVDLNKLRDDVLKEEKVTPPAVPEDLSRPTHILTLYPTKESFMALPEEMQGEIATERGYTIQEIIERYYSHVPPDLEALRQSIKDSGHEI